MKKEGVKYSKLGVVQYHWSISSVHSWKYVLPRMNVSWKVKGWKPFYTKICQTRSWYTLIRNQRGLRNGWRHNSSSRHEWWLYYISHFIQCSGTDSIWHFHCKSAENWALSIHDFAFLWYFDGYGSKGPPIKCFSHKSV